MKTYKKPLARIIELETESIIADSNLGYSTESSNNASSTDDFAVGSYRKKLWED